MFLQPILLERRSLTLRVDRNHTRTTTVQYLQSEATLTCILSRLSLDSQRAVLFLCCSFFGASEGKKLLGMSDLQRQ